MYATLNISSVNCNISLPLCGGEAEEEEKTDEKHEGDGAADVGHGSHSRDGHRHLFFPSSRERHPDMKTVGPGPPSGHSGPGQTRKTF